MMLFLSSLSIDSEMPPTLLTMHGRSLAFRKVPWRSGGPLFSLQAVSVSESSYTTWLSSGCEAASGCDCPGPSEFSGFALGRGAASLPFCRPAIVCCCCCCFVFRIEKIFRKHLSPSRDSTNKKEFPASWQKRRWARRKLVKRRGSLGAPCPTPPGLWSLCALIFFRKETRREEHDRSV